MADRMNNPLSTLRPGGYVNDISLGAMMRPPLSMPVNGWDQTEERTLLGGTYQTPIHSENLPAGMKYGSEEYDGWRESLVGQRALQQGINTEVMPYRNGPNDAPTAMKQLNRLSWARGEGSGQEDKFGRGYHRGAPANAEAQDNQIFIERELWNKNLQERFGRR